MKFTADRYTATKWSTAADKAKFANHFVRFVEGDFKITLFPDWFYKRLSMTFGHIAHYNKAGFYAEWFSTPARQLEFLNRVAAWHSYGDPKYTYCDVEKDLAAWVGRDKGDLVRKLKERCIAEVEAKERAELARLKAKYETGGCKNVPFFE